jgi:hypothetical protein
MALSYNTLCVCITFYYFICMYVRIEIILCCVGLAGDIIPGEGAHRAQRERCSRSQRRQWFIAFNLQLAPLLAKRGVVIFNPARKKAEKAS